jgi:chromosome segregation ATPase
MASASSKLRKAIEDVGAGLAVLSEVADLVDQRDEMEKRIHALEDELRTAQTAHDEGLGSLTAAAKKEQAEVAKLRAMGKEQLDDLRGQKTTVEGWLADTRASIQREREQHQAALKQDLAAHEEALGRLQKAKVAAERELASYQERLKGLQGDLAGALGRTSG